MQPVTATCVLNRFFLLWKQNFALYGKNTRFFQEPPILFSNNCSKNWKICSRFIHFSTFWFCLKGVQIEYMGRVQIHIWGFKSNTSSRPVTIWKKRAFGHTQCAESPLFLRFFRYSVFPFVSIQRVLFPLTLENTKFIVDELSSVSADSPLSFLSFYKFSIFL